ncbi:hypothetical protein [Luteimonas sp. TWI1437]|uniref:hypothetical protein n=1 Tax=unclassified Luteimonas TaxID=2629088 RepID=UPI0032085922
MSTLRPLLNLFGRPYDDDEVIRSLATLPPHKAQRPSDGSQYVVSKAGGFELMFEDPNTRGAGHRQHRTLAAVFLFNAGVDGYSRYAGTIPFGFSLDDTRSALIARHPPDLT